MSLIKELFFPTPIYYTDLEGADALNQFLLTRIYAWRDQEGTGIIRSNSKQTGAWHSPTTMNIREEYRIFVERIDGFVAQLFSDQLYCTEYEASCLNMWANISEKYGYNRNHTHPGSVWSGVYYVQTPKDCGRVVFQEPRIQSQVLQPVKLKKAGQTPELWSEVFHEAVAGRLILFPSWLGHEVEPNMSELPNPEGDRISISFNYIQRKKLD